MNKVTRMWEELAGKKIKEGGDRGRDFTLFYPAFSQGRRYRLALQQQEYILSAGWQV